MVSLDWEVLLAVGNLDRTLEIEHDSEPYLADHYDYIYTSEYDMLFGQFAENENALTGRPPASKSVVKNLPVVVLTQGDVENNNALCAVCKDEINVGELASSYLAVTAIMGIALCHGLVYGIHALFVVMSCLQMILSMSKGETEELVASE
ncbi:hypothetical protein CK203_011434 [Vitis vinifera]|uniref:Uncharacterized protein n=1 Tax=Vitis vinifera TaxID=29760 RepID=A0A438JYJ5_VITVI|nr:hypothetical protein CK203_011434 [Vitis vinifera]